ncbi:MAG: orotate phosphoribosyltransferase [Candidatus Omnitrophota bacterium]
MKEAEVLKIFQESGALQSGHFKLSSGLHSGQYMQCALVLQHPRYAEKLCKALAEKFKDDKVAVVVGPAIGGIVVSCEVGRALGVRSIFTEREDGKTKFRRGFSVDKNDRVLVVEDVVTTGKSTKEVLEVIRSTGASIVGIGALVDRLNGTAFNENYASLVRIEIPTFKPEECPLCKKEQPVIKPGSRS